MGFAGKFMSENQNRVLGLDIMRSIAILLVVYGHGVFMLPKSFKFYYLLPMPSIDGVSVFFVLSGFLIGGILLKIIQRSDFTAKDLGNFWIRRWFRTLPNYYFVLTALVIYQFAVLGNAGGFDLSYYFFFQNFSWAHPGFFPEAWSLCVEEWFYLLFPIFCFLIFKMIRNKSRSLLFAALIFITIPFVLRIIMYVTGTGMDNWNDTIQKVVVMRLDSLMYGIIAAYFFKFRKEVWIEYKNVCLVFSVLLAMWLTLYPRLIRHDMAFLTVYQYNLESLASMLALPYFSMVKNSRFRYVSFIFTFISVISYSMYLLNLTPVQGAMIPAALSLFNLEQNGSLAIHMLQYFLFWFFVIAGSYFLYRYFEKPMTDLRDRVRFS